MAKKFTYININKIKREIMLPEGWDRVTSGKLLASDKYLNLETNYIEEIE